MSDGETIKQIASRVYATYRAAALRQIARGAWTRDEADRRLQPWGAIALLADGEITGVTDRLDELCPRVEHFSGKPRPVALATTQRAVLAFGLCPRTIWEPALARARSEAMVRADSLRDGDPAAFERAMATWRDLDHLARALDLPLRLLCEADAAAAIPKERIAA